MAETSRPRDRNSGPIAAGLAGGMLALFLLAFLEPRAAPADPSWSIEARLGATIDFPSPLTIHQDGESDLRLTARYDSRPFQLPLYWMLRITRQEGDHRWSAELIHHKIYLRNPPPEIGEFAVSHGYNLLTISHAWRTNGLWAGAGAGVVIAHPENTVRGRKLEESGGPFGGGYHIAGPSAAMFVTRDVPLDEHWFVPIEARATGAWARLPVAGGHAEAPNFALHGTVGVGYRGW